MLGISKINPVARAIGTVGAVAAIAAGATFANINSTATLTDNEVSTTTADLKLWNGSTWASTAPGFHVDNFVPGSAPQNAFYLQNNSAVALAITAHVPIEPSATGFTNWDNLIVQFTNDKTSDGCNGTNNVVNTTMTSLLAGQVALPCNPLSAGATGNGGAANTEGNYKVKFDINPSAITGSSASVTSFNVQLTGTQP